MKVAMIGTGYVGLVSGTCFAETGVEVTCVDNNRKKIEDLKKGIIPIYEPGLSDLVIKNTNNNRLKFSTSLKESVEKAEAVFIAVGTPPDEDGSADLQYVLAVAREIGQNMKDYLVVVTKSTVPVGTSKLVGEAIQEELDKRGVDIPFDLASNPEFLKEGDAVNDFLKPDRIVVGVETERATLVLEKLYKPFVLNGHPIIAMDIASAEVTKYAANSMLATRISFINDVANFCELVGADINKVRKGIGSDPRIGPRFIYPGTGYGGSCFPKDVQALIRKSDDMGYSMRLLKAVEEINDDQKSIMVNKLKKFYDDDLKGKKVALWGLSFKPKTDDMREAPSLVIIDQLLEADCEVSAFDPVAMDECKRKIGDTIVYCKDQYEALIDADALILVTEWADFRVPNLNVIKKLMKRAIIFDGRNIYDSDEMKENQIDYFCIGR